MQITAQLVKAFTTDKSQGNPAGVVLNADNLSGKQMLKIAAKLGFSESAFVQTSARADFRIRFFSVRQEVDFCGHATIAAFHAIMGHNHILVGNKQWVTIRQETNVGILPVTCHTEGKIVMDQNDPVFSEVISDKSVVTVLLNIEPAAISNSPIQIVSTGTPKLIIPITSLANVRRIAPNLRSISEYCRQHNVKGFYPFTAQTLKGTSDFYARQFNPLAGINEDPITGIAAGALGCYANRYGLAGGRKQFVIEQGYDMKMGGEMYVDITNGVKVGGYAVTYGEQRITL